MSGERYSWKNDEREMIDLLWCAAHLNRILSPSVIEELPNVTVPQTSDENEREDISSSVDRFPPPSTEEQASAAPVYTASPPPTDESRFTPEAPLPSPVSPVRLPDPFPLPAPFEMGKSLLPLSKRVPGLGAWDIDIDQTVDQTAEANGLPIIAFNPQLERWFDLQILVDSSPSMDFWGDLTDSIRTVFEWQGIFRDIRVWHFETHHGDKTPLYSGEDRLERDIRSLLAPSQNRLFLVVTDTLGQAWRSGEAFNQLALLGQQHSVAIAHIFPPQLWLRTELEEVIMRAFYPGCAGQANAKLRETELIPTQAPFQRFPILSINAEHLGTWAKFVTGGSTTHQGFLRYPDPLEVKEELSDDCPALPIPEISEEKLDAFFYDATDQAKTLLSVLAAVPLIPPVMRLAQQRYLPQTDHSHLAEIFFSGLVKRSIFGDEAASVNETWYEFIPQVRERLLNRSSVTLIAQVHREISHFVEERYGSPRDFQALIPNESGSMETTIQNRDAYFAEVRASVLMTWGGEFAQQGQQLLEQVTTKRKELKGESDTITQPLNHDYPDLPPLTEFSFNPPDIIFEPDWELPPIETKEVEVATLSFESPIYQFEFDVVTLLRASELPIRRPSQEELFSTDRFDSPPSPGARSYQTYQALQEAEQEGIDYRIRIKEKPIPCAIVAPHGGKIEPGASEIAKAIAGDDLNLYVFEGLKEAGNSLLALPRNDFDEPSLDDVLSSVSTVLEIHGVKPLGNQVWIGGSDVEWCQSLELALQSAGFQVKLHRRTISPNALCNRGIKGQGIYLDISQGLRRQLVNSLESLDTSQNSLFDRFIQAIRSTIPELTSTWGQVRESHQTESFREVLTDTVSIEMVAIPGGTFLMGSSEEDEFAESNECPQHEVTVPDFIMGRYPVTQAQWWFVSTLPKIKDDLDVNPSEFSGENHPVETVSWNDAVEFCQRLSQQTGREYRLPTEAEWEYACRAGTQTPFHFGEMITTDVANYNGAQFNGGPKGERRSQTTPVSALNNANQFGLSGMHGNVWEWCFDHWHGNYKGAPTDGSSWIEGGDDNFRSLRGGSWLSYPEDCRSASRGDDTPDNHDLNIGFRVVCSVRVTP